MDETTADPQEYGHLSSGVELFNAGQFSAAAAAYSCALEVRPDRASTHYNLANALLNCGRDTEAVAAYQRALELRADFPPAWNNLGNALRRSARLIEAVDAFRHALQLEPQSATVCNNLGLALMDLGHTREALSLYDRAIVLCPRGFDAPRINKASLLMETGEGAGARHVVDEILELNPDLVAAWHLRVALKTVTADDSDLNTLESLLERADALGLAGADRIRLRFVLGKAWLDAGHSDRAFAHLEYGNRLERATFEYDSVAATTRLAQIAATCTPGLLREVKARGAGHPTEVPIFIVGMPRSGTTLIEQVLASHPAVEASGELTFLGQLVDGAPGADPYAYPPLYPSLLAQASGTHLTHLGRKYEAQVRELRPDKARVIDKNPLNFPFAGFIHAILPNARIIHCRRDALDTCLSCYTRLFNGAVPFAYDMGELGRYCRQHEALADHWREVLPPERYMEVRYEELVGNLEREARRLLEFCDLPWHAQCLSFHDTGRHVRTSSALAVRKPVYRTSIGRARDYARYLGPLLAALT